MIPVSYQTNENKLSVFERKHSMSDAIKKAIEALNHSDLVCSSSTKISPIPLNREERSEEKRSLENERSKSEKFYDFIENSLHEKLKEAHKVFPKAPLEERLMVLNLATKSHSCSETLSFKQRSKSATNGRFLNFFRNAMLSNNFFSIRFFAADLSIEKNLNLFTMPWIMIVRMGH